MIQIRRSCLITLLLLTAIVSGLASAAITNARLKWAYFDEYFYSGLLEGQLAGLEAWQQAERAHPKDAPLATTSDDYRSLDAYLKDTGMLRDYVAYVVDHVQTERQTTAPGLPPVDRGQLTIQQLRNPKYYHPFLKERIDWIRFLRNQLS